MKHEAEDETARRRLLEEGRLLAGLRHPNLVTVHDLDFHEDRPFLVLDYVRGVHLRRYIQNGLDFRDVAGKLAKAARALGAAHRQGIVHLDLKPQNIVIDENGEPVVIDFGLAQLADAWSDTVQTPGGGTPQYMAPEQARLLLEPHSVAETAIGPAADIFGLGAVLYRLLCGRAPFAAEDSRAAATLSCASRWDESALEQPGIPRRLASISRRAMQADPAARYRSADEMADALERFASPPTRRRWLAAVGLGLVVAMWPPFPPLALPDVAAKASFLAARSSHAGKHERFADLSDVVPISNEDLLRIEANLPPEFEQVAVFVYSGDVGWQRVGDSRVLVSRQEASLQVRVPASDGTRFQLKAPRGVCLILICARRHGPIEPPELKPLFGDIGDWPELPEDDSCVAFDKKQTWLPNARGAEFSDAPEKPIIERVEAVRREMAKRFDFVHGMVFQHR